MRDILITLLVFGAVPWMIKRPYVGLLFWVWLSIMNPHRLAYGFAYTLPFAQVVALATLTGMLVQAKTLYRPEWNAGILSLILFTLWVCVSPLFAFHDYGEFDPWLRVIKIMAMVVITYFVVGNQRELHLLTIVLTFSIAFYGIKGGLFTIATAGNYKVWGPEGSFVGDNNTIACAIIMALPLIRYVQLQAQRPITRRACGLAMLLCIAAAVGSHSRGALVGLFAMGLFFWLKSGNKFSIGVIAIALVLVVFAVMPESWTSRMSTIDRSEVDESGQGRLDAWKMTFNLAKSRVLIGGGFNIYTRDVFERFAPDVQNRAAHSIYFQVLGEHGFMGLAIFLFIFGQAWYCGTRILRSTRNRSELKWAADLAAMCQVSIIAYASAGAFLSLTYYDFPYYVAAILNITLVVVKRSLKESPTMPDSPTPARLAQNALRN